MRKISPFLVASVFAALAIYFMSTSYVSVLRSIRLTQWYGAVSILILYFYVFGESLKIDFAKKFILPFFIFIALHFVFGFFGELGGFGGLPLLPTPFFAGVIIGTALATFIIFYFGSLFIKKRQRLSKVLLLLFQISSLLTLLHVLIVGTHFANYQTTQFRVTFALSVILLFSYSVRIDKFFKGIPVATFVVFLLAGMFLPAVYFGNNIFKVPNINIHSQSMLAENSMDMSSMNELPAYMSQVPSMRGDKTKRFNVSFEHEDKIVANKNTTIKFKINNASNGNSNSLFLLSYTKMMHLVVVDEQLKFFEHIHPEQNGSTFEIDTKFPHGGTYHLYVTFQPYGAIEQKFAFILDVEGKAEAQEPFVLDSGLTKEFGEVSVTLETSEISASKISRGEQTIAFSLKNINTGEPVTNLNPYLGAFGHLIMIDTSTYDYLHIHPKNTVSPLPEERGGPLVEFLPMTVFDPIKPGVYRMFVELSPAGKLFVGVFTVEVK